MSIYDEYQRFWKRLSKVERAALEAAGFNANRPEDSGVPFAHRYFSGEPSDGDACEGGEENFSEGGWGQGYDINQVQAVQWRMRERNETQVSDRTFTQDEVLDILRKVIAVIDLSTHAEVRLHGTCIKLALGIPDQPTMTALANQHSLTRAAISARVKTIQRNLKLPPSLYMKSDAACKKLSNARRKKLK
jgi:hypothetical protein